MLKVVIIDEQAASLNAGLGISDKRALEIHERTNVLKEEDPNGLYVVEKLSEELHHNPNEFAYACIGMGREFVWDQIITKIPNTEIRDYVVKVLNIPKFTHF